jgi:hypothetical protein
MDTILNFLIPFLIFALMLRWMLRMLLSSDIWSDYLARIIGDTTLGIWHWIGGYPKRRIVLGKCGRRRRRH